MLLANALTAQAYNVSIGTHSTYGQVAYLSNFTESDLQQGDHLYVPGYVKSGANWYPTIVSSGAVNAMSTMWYVVAEYGCLGFESSAVKNCSKLTYVILPSSVKFLANNFILNSGHPSNILNLSLAGETAFNIGQQAFASINNTGLLIKTSSRAAAQMWADIFSDLTLPSGISATAKFSWNSPAYDYTFHMTNGASLFFVVTTPPTATQRESRKWWVPPVTAAILKCRFRVPKRTKAKMWPAGCKRCTARRWPTVPSRTRKSLDSTTCSTAM